MWRRHEPVVSPAHQQVADVQHVGVVDGRRIEPGTIAAFDLQAVGYLLKPVRANNLEAALGRAQRINKAQLAALSDDVLDSLNRHRC